MIKDSSIYTTNTNTIEKTLLYIDGYLNKLENLFLVTDTLSENREIRKYYILLLETTVDDLKIFRTKLEKIKTYSIDVEDLSDYLKNTKI